jgi:radical SAM protein with 4Fe4S-binding SPASM domain
MVTAGRTFGWARRAVAAVRDDVRRWRAVVDGRFFCKPGLRMYRVRHPSGGSRRIHLRTHADGSAVMLVDVSDAIHLNPTAALLARLALDRTPAEHAGAVVRSRFRHVEAAGLRREVARVYDLVDHLAKTDDVCPTCGLDDVRRPPLFSVPVAAPYKVDLALTYGCNNACRHCYNRCGRTESEVVGGDSSRRSRRSNDTQFRQSATGVASYSLAQWRQALRRLASVGVPHIIFTGGEPTLFEGLAHLIQTAGRLGLVAGLNTNGRRLSDREFAASLRRAGLDHVQITLESHAAGLHNAMTGAASFDETVRGIENSLAVGLHTITNTTLTRHNLGQALETVDFLHRLGLRTFAMNGMIHAGGGCTSGDAVAVEELGPVLLAVRDRARALGMRLLWYTPTEYCRLSPVELELGARRCNAGEYSMCIEPNGDVLPCQSYYTPVGNILRDPWHRIWQSGLFRSFRRRAAEPAACGLPERCWNCPDLPLCGGGCRIERENENATHHGETISGWHG